MEIKYLPTDIPCMMKNDGKLITRAEMNKSARSDVDTSNEAKEWSMRLLELGIKQYFDKLPTTREAYIEEKYMHTFYFIVTRRWKEEEAAYQIRDELIEFFKSVNENKGLDIDTDEIRAVLSCNFGIWNLTRENMITVKSYYEKYRKQKEEIIENIDNLFENEFFAIPPDEDFSVKIERASKNLEQYFDELNSVIDNCSKHWLQTMKDDGRDYIERAMVSNKVCYNDETELKRAFKLFAAIYKGDEDKIKKHEEKLKKIIPESINTQLKEIYEADIKLVPDMYGQYGTYFWKSREIEMCVKRLLDEYSRPLQDGQVSGKCYEYGNYFWICHKIKICMELLLNECNESVQNAKEKENQFNNYAVTLSGAIKKLIKLQKEVYHELGIKFKSDFNLKGDISKIINSDISLYGPVWYRAKGVKPPLPKDNSEIDKTL